MDITIKFQNTKQYRRPTTLTGIKTTKFKKTNTMNPQFPKLLLLMLCIFSFSCQKPLFPDDDGPISKADWKAIDFQCERQILGLHATPFEWYAITENQFFRFDGEDGLLEIRPLPTESGVKGVPALSDNAFFRMTLSQGNRQVIEFHHARNPASSVLFPVDSLERDAGTFLEVEFLSRQLGAFSGDGTLFLLPVKVLPQRNYAFYLFEIQQQSAQNAFASIKLAKRINIPGMDAELANLKSTRFLDGNFYVASAVGAWRISPAGQALQIFPQWMLDFFSLKGTLYATGLNSFDLHKSADNGLTWERLNQNSEVKYAETADTLVFSETTLGNRYQVVSADFKKARDIEHPADAPTDPSVFYSVVFFGGRYYFSMDRKVFSISQIITK